MATYEICGTCSILCDGAKTEVRLFPAEGYLSPNKKRALLHPSGINSATCEIAFLRTLKNDEGNEKLCWLEFEETEQNNILPIFQQAAATQQKIKLIVEECASKLKIIQCIFPVP